MSNNKAAVISDRRFVQTQTNPSKIISQKDFYDFHTIWKKDQNWLNRVGSAMIDHKIKSADLSNACFEMCERMHMPRKYTEKNLYHMKAWAFQEYGLAFSKKRRRLNGQNAWWIAIDLPLVIDMMKRNNRFPSDELVEEVFGENENEPC